MKMNEIKDITELRFHITDEMNDMFIEMILLEQMIDDNPSFKSIFDKKFNKLRENFIKEFRKNNQKEIKLYHELINK